MKLGMPTRQFQRAIRKFAEEEVPYIGKTVHKAVAEFVYEGIVTKTPVLTGHARHNWYPSVGAAVTTVTPDTANVSVTGQPMTPEEQARIKTATSHLNALPLGYSAVWIANNVPYIQKLEDGSSPKSPPNAMVQGTIINTLDGLKITIKPRGA